MGFVHFLVAYIVRTYFVLTVSSGHRFLFPRFLFHPSLRIRHLLLPIPSPSRVSTSLCFQKTPHASERPMKGRGRTIQNNVHCHPWNHLDQSDHEHQRRQEMKSLEMALAFLAFESHLLVETAREKRLHLRRLPYFHQFLRFFLYHHHSRQYSHSYHSHHSKHNHHSHYSHHCCYKYYPSPSFHPQTRSPRIESRVLVDSH
mmetsp:Transcript_7618/g.14942  ORF Transcript_7618/g.14942 Transcript_7618/m.14942 type:complete len:201 (-) Transcript_7618:285-887(-)